MGDLVDYWTRSDDAHRRLCGYGLLSEMAQFKGRRARDDTYFLEHIRRISEAIALEGSGVHLAMGGALMNIGKRNAVLNAAALRVAQRTGPIEFESPSGRCEPFDVSKHLTSERLRKKLGIQGGGPMEIGSDR